MLKKFIAQFLNKLNEYQTIAIFIHVQPDFDAYGSAFALKKWIEDNFEEKNIHMMIPPETFKSNEKILFNSDKKIPHSSELQNAIGIILDTPIQDRILTQMHFYCKELILIDHHPKIDAFAQLEFINPIYPATSQILAEIFLELENEKKMVFNSEVAQSLYSGILTDTNNLMALSVIPTTYEIIAKLIYKGINRNLVHNSIFMLPLNQKIFNQKVIGKIKTTKNGLAYSIIDSKIIKKYKMQESPNIINNLENIQKIEIWTTLSYDFEIKRWKCSIRSKDLHINTIAAKFGGGGHKNMAAVILKNKRDYYKLLIMFDTFLKNTGFKNISNYKIYKNSFNFWFYFVFYKFMLKDKYLN